MTTLPTGGTDSESYFVDIGLDWEEPTVEVPPLKKKKKKAGLNKKIFDKYP